MCFHLIESCIGNSLRFQHPCERHSKIGLHPFSLKRIAGPEPKYLPSLTHTVKSYTKNSQCQEAFSIKIDFQLVTRTHWKKRRGAMHYHQWVWRVNRCKHHSQRDIRVWKQIVDCHHSPLFPYHYHQSKYPIQILRIWCILITRKVLWDKIHISMVSGWSTEYGDGNSI